MAKSIFTVSCLMADQYKSMKQVSEFLIGYLIKLSELEPAVLAPVFATEKIKNSLSIDIANPKKSSELLANLLLKKYKGQMLADTGIKVDSANVSRSLGFRFLLKCYIGNTQIFAITGNLGATYPHIIIEYFDKARQLDFDWYFAATKGMVDYCQPLYAVTRLIQPHYSTPVNELRVTVPLGWINYFSEEYVVSIPDDIAGFEYISTSKGKYMIFTREDFTKDKESYFPESERLLTAVKEVKNRVPNYSLDVDRTN